MESINNRIKLTEHKIWIRLPATGNIVSSIYYHYFAPVPGNFYSAVLSNIRNK